MNKLELGEQYQQTQRDDGFGAVRKVLGFLLLAVGVVVAGWICLTIYRILSDPEKVAFFYEFLPENPGMREMEIEGKMILLPPGAFTLFAYAIGAFLLFIGAKIASAFIAGGVRLLQPDLRLFEKRTNRSFDGLVSRLDGLKQTLDRKSL